MQTILNLGFSGFKSIYKLSNTKKSSSHSRGVILSKKHFQDNQREPILNLEELLRTQQGIFQDWNIINLKCFACPILQLPGFPCFRKTRVLVFVTRQKCLKCIKILRIYVENVNKRAPFIMLDGHVKKKIKIMIKWKLAALLDISVNQSSKKKTFPH